MSLDESEAVAVPERKHWTGLVASLCALPDGKEHMTEKHKQVLQVMDDVDNAETLTDAVNVVDKACRTRGHVLYTTRKRWDNLTEGICWTADPLLYDLVRVARFAGFVFRSPPDDKMTFTKILFTAHDMAIIHFATDKLHRAKSYYSAIDCALTYRNDIAVSLCGRYVYLAKKKRNGAPTPFFPEEVAHWMLDNIWVLGNPLHEHLQDIVRRVSSLFAYRPAHEQGLLGLIKAAETHVPRRSPELIVNCPVRDALFLQNKFAGGSPELIATMFRINRSPFAYHGHKRLRRDHELARKVLGGDLSMQREYMNELVEDLKGRISIYTLPGSHEPVLSEEVCRAMVESKVQIDNRLLISCARPLAKAGYKLLDRNILWIITHGVQLRDVAKVFDIYGAEKQRVAPIWLSRLEFGFADKVARDFVEEWCRPKRKAPDSQSFIPGAKRPKYSQ
jgi:hypothetical protein